MKHIILAGILCLGTTAAFAQEHNHADHAHADDHGHGEHNDLGTTTVAGTKFQIFQLGKAEGKEAAFELVLAKDTKSPKAIRLWAGVESAEGSVKARAEGNGPDFDVHVELPNPLSANAQLWIEIQPADGKKEKAAFDLKR